MAKKLMYEKMFESGHSFFKTYFYIQKDFGSKKVLVQNFFVQMNFWVLRIRHCGTFLRYEIDVAGWRVAGLPNGVF